MGKSTKAKKKVPSDPVSKKEKSQTTRIIEKSVNPPNIPIKHVVGATISKKFK